MPQQNWKRGTTMNELVVLEKEFEGIKVRVTTENVSRTENIGVDKLIENVPEVDFFRIFKEQQNGTR